MQRHKQKLFYLFIGTTAELIKLAPVIKRLRESGANFKIITSGQNKVHFEEFSSWTGVNKPDISFAEKANKSSVLLFLFWACKTFLLSLLKLRKELAIFPKDRVCFIVHGDTVSALIGCFIAKLSRVRLAHIESGLYSDNLLEPFPEELSRNIIDRLADVNFPHNEWAKGHVEGFRGEAVETFGNTLMESFFWSKKIKPVSRTLGNLKKIKKYYILIMHRQEHVIFRRNWSREVLEFVIKTAGDDLSCILLGHPLTVDIIKTLKITPQTRKRIKIVPRLPYPDFMKLVEKTEFMATDGCMNQLEAYYMGVPLLALRDRTEQIEGLGKNVLICGGDKAIIRDFLKNYGKYRSKPVVLKNRRLPSKTIVDYLLKS